MTPTQQNSGRRTSKIQERCKPKSIPQIKANHGFSLIELVIVIVILAILSTLAVVHYQKYIDQARRREAQFQIIDLIAQAEQYYLKNKTYPENIESLIVPTSRFYKFTGKQCGISCFQVTAEILESGEIQEIQGMERVQTTHEMKNACASLTLDTRGTRTPTTPNCWQYR